MAYKLFFFIKRGNSVFFVLLNSYLRKIMGTDNKPNTGKSSQITKHLQTLLVQLLLFFNKTILSITEFASQNVKHNATSTAMPFVLRI